jgi:hypothetical protein
MGVLRERWRRLVPPDGPRRTALNALVAGALLLGGFAALAQSCSARFAMPFEMERYMRAGARQGALDLARDLAAQHPPGAAVAPLFGRLHRLGFECGGTLGGHDTECRFRGRREDGRIATVEVVVAHDGLVLAGIAARMSLQPP